MVAVAALALACGPPAKVAKGPARPITEWAGDDADLFDDGIDVGSIPPAGGTEQVDDVNDLKITARIYAADGVVTAKVIGVSSEPVGDRNRYRLELAVEGEALAGARIESPFTLKVEQGSPAYGAIRSQDAQLIGRKFTVYYKSYAIEDSEGLTHFHLSANSAHVVGLVNAATTKKKVEGH